MERHALPVRLVEAFNKVEIKVISKKMLSNYTFVTSKYNRGAAARRGGASHALPTRRGGASRAPVRFAENFADLFDKFKIKCYNNI